MMLAKKCLIKPAIPMVVENGIPIRDEIVLQRSFSHCS